MLCNYYSSMLSGCVVADMMELKRMMEKLGQPKTHLELKKMIAEVDTNNSGTAIILHIYHFIHNAHIPMGLMTRMCTYIDKGS